MKRVLIFTCLSLALPTFAQDGTRAAVAAENQRAEERYQRMAADVEALQAANASLQKKIVALEESLQKLREAQAKPADNSGVQDDLKKLADRIQEVDKKRESDKEVISEEIKKSIAKLERALTGSPGGSPHGGTSPGITPVADPGNADTYTYVIKPNNTLGAIVQAYNEEFKKKGLKTITRKQVMELNPKVNWDRLLIDQKILIPKPGPAN